MKKDAGTVGFGTTSLLGIAGDRERQYLLEAALDAGITHFDTAPYYGYGEAERILGRFLVGRRDAVTVTTKFGIQPPRLAGGGTLAGALKRVVKNLGPLRSLLAKQAGKMVQRGAFGVEDARKSLESSLRALQTDRLDVYLLHEAGPADTSDELLAFLESKKQEGVIGAFGTGSEAAKVSDMARLRPSFADAVQLENSVLKTNLRSLAPMKNPRLVFTHGALGASFRALQEILRADETFRMQCSEILGADAGNPRLLAPAMLAWAARDNKTGTVLFSSRTPENIRSNMNALRNPTFTEEQLDEFAQLVASVVAGKEKVAS